MRLLLDEHYSPRIAEHHQAQGHDVTAVAGQLALAGLADRRLIAAARAEGRAFLTENVGDFLSIAAELARIETPHAGIILANGRRFPRSRDDRQARRRFPRSSRRAPAGRRPGGSSRLARVGRRALRIDIRTLAVLDGGIAPRALGLVMEWAAAHQPELAEDWRLAADGHEPLKIAPLA